MSIMNSANVVVDELTEEQGRSLFERACRDELQVSTDEFLRHYDADTVPDEWDVRAVNRLEFLLPYVR